MGFIKKQKIEFDQSLREICVIDFETTGLKPGNDRPIEVGACVLENGVITDKFQTLIDPEIDIPSEITEITGINNNMVKGKPKSEDVMAELRRFLKNRPILGHNISFDKRFLDAEMSLIGRTVDNPTLCTLLMSRRLIKNTANFKLPTLAQYFNIVATDAHRALADVIVTARVWLRIYETVKAITGIDVPDIKVFEKLSKTPKARIIPLLKALENENNR